MNEFESMIQKQEEMRKLVTQVNSNESSLSKQVLVLTEKFNKTMEEDDEDSEVASQVSKVLFFLYIFIFFYFKIFLKFYFIFLYYFYLFIYYYFIYLFIILFIYFY